MVNSVTENNILNKFRVWLTVKFLSSLKHVRVLKKKTKSHKKKVLIKLRRNIKPISVYSALNIKLAL